MKQFKHALLAVAIAAPLTAFAAPKVSIDGPGDSSIQSGVTQIYGWTSDVEPITKVELYIDGNDAEHLQIGMGGERADVQAMFPNDHDPLHSGFATAFHTKLLSNGPHTITIEVENQSGQKTEVSRTIIVSNTPEDNVLTDTIDLSGATARISGDHIFLDGVVVNGVTYSNFELKFDDVINGFRLIGFRDDHDGDGFDDDDMDHDGFDDDDSDRDGFDDDDEDRDGLSDDDDPDHDAGDDNGGDRPDGVSDDGPDHDVGDDNGGDDDDDDDDDDDGDDDDDSDDDNGGNSGSGG